MAKAWVEREPERGRRYRRLHYPAKGDGRGVKEGEVLRDEGDVWVGENGEVERQERVGWEVAHLPGVGAYGLDSWRIFCRDELRGVGGKHESEKRGEGKEEGGTKKGGQDTEDGVEEEWKRVVPMDKELRAYLRWRWLKEGWVWDPLTGKRRRATEKEMRDAEDGGVIVEGEEGDVVESKEEVDASREDEEE